MDRPILFRAAGGGAGKRDPGGGQEEDRDWLQQYRSPGTGAPKDSGGFGEDQGSQAPGGAVETVAGGKGEGDRAEPIGGRGGGEAANGAKIGGDGAGDDPVGNRSAENDRETSARAR